MFNRVVWWLLCVSAAVMWVSTSVSLSMWGKPYRMSQEALLMGTSAVAVALAASVIFSSGLLVTVYRGWDALNQARQQDMSSLASTGIGRDIPAQQAVLLLFIPVFSIFWQFVAFSGWATRAEQLAEHTGAGRGALMPAIPAVAIVGTLVSAILMLCLPPVGVMVGITATGAWLVTAHAMLNWPVVPQFVPRDRGMAYFGIVTGRLDLRILIGTFVVVVGAGALSGSASFHVMNAYFVDHSIGGLSYGSWLWRATLVRAVVTSMVVAVPALLGVGFRIRHPGLLLPFVALATVIGFVVNHIGYSVLSGSWEGAAPLIFFPVLYGITGVVTSALVLGALWWGRPAAVAIAVALAPSLLVSNLVENAASLVLTYALGDGDWITSNNFWVPWTEISPTFFRYILEASLIAAGLAILHRLCRSPLIATAVPLQVDPGCAADART